MDNDDDYDFSFDGLDDLPADTLHQLESAAIQATQAPVNAPASDYGLEDGDGDEVINLDDDVAPPQASPWVDLAESRYGRAMRSQEDVMDVDEQPRQSQVDVGRLLERIKKVQI
jgi:hypothetical protein